MYAISRMLTETTIDSVRNKNRRKAIFNWAAKGAIFSEGRGRLYTLRLPQNLVADHCMGQNRM